MWGCVCGGVWVGVGVIQLQQFRSFKMCACVYVSVCLCVCVRACVRERARLCVCARARACLRV